MNELFGDLNKPVLSELKVSEIKPDPKQPRKHFDQSALDELAKTIKDDGIIQPIVVRTDPDGDGYIVIAGERRWRAAGQVDLETVPAIVRDDLNARTASLIENVQRVNLKPVEEADAIAELIAEEGVSQKEVGALIGKSRVAVNHMMKIRKLPEKIKKESIALDTPKAVLFELSRLKDDAVVTHLWKKSKKDALTVAEIRLAGEKKKKKTEPGEKSAMTSAERALDRAWGAVTTLKKLELTEKEKQRLWHLKTEIEGIL